jgi:hypothetical protein
MGVGAGLALLAILVLSASCAVLSICRFALQSKRTRKVVIVAPLVACCYGVLSVVGLRMISPPIRVYEFFAICALLVGAIGFLVGCIPLRK